MIDQLYPVHPGGLSTASPRRLPGGWLWASRVLWVVVFVTMTLLNGAAIVAHVERNASGVGGGAAGVKVVPVEEHGWVLRVDPTGPAAKAGIHSGDQLMAINGVDVPAEATYREMNRQLYGGVGDPLTLRVRGGQGEVHEYTVTLVEEDVLQIWRRFRVPLGIVGAYLPTIEAILLAGYLLMSALIFFKRSDDWLALYLTLTLVLITPQLSYSWYYLSQTAAHWDKTFQFLMAFAVALTLPNFYLLPNGRFVPPWTVVLAVIWVLWSITTELFPAAPFSLYHTSGATQLLVWLGWYATGMLAQIYRYRYDATPTEKQQIKWVAFGLTVAVVVNLGWTLAFELFPVLSRGGQLHQIMWWIGRTVYVLGMMVLPISFGIAVFRYRLWDIDNLINRTLVYGTLTAVIVGIYVVVVAVFDALFSSQGQVISQIIAITLDLIIFEPLRERLQKGVDRLMFGESDDLPTVIAKLGQKLSAAGSADEVLPTIVETLADSLNLSYVAINLAEQVAGAEGFHVAAENGMPVMAHYTLPLVYHRQVVGQLLLVPRVVGEPFKPHEWEVIQNVAYQIGIAAHDILLEKELVQRKLEAT